MNTSILMNKQANGTRISFPALAWCAAVLSVLLLTGCGTKEAKDGSAPERPHPARTEEPARKVLYQCPMHAHIIRDKPGSCPICGMELVPIEDREDSAGATAPVVRLEAAVVRNIGVRTEAARMRSLGTDLRLNGTVAVDEANVFSVTARVDGYVENLNVVSTGQAVKAGETLLELYSPELVTAQQEFLQGTGGTGNPSESRERLRNWGVSEAFVKRLEKTRKIERRVPIVATATGTITRKEVVKGQAVEAGMELFRIADLSKVWVTARAYPSDLPWLKAGTAATLRIGALPGREFTAEVLFVSPELDPVNRTAEVRLKLPNTPGQELRPGLFAEVRIGKDKNGAEALTVPSQSLIRSGGREVAVVALGGGRFQPREVRIGRETSEWVEILGGLEEGEEVVVAVQFLIDAESNLRAAIASISASGSLSDSGTDPDKGGDHVR